ncbi:hypothetical protein RhiirC2_789685 [Rhizophagus irregularis]|uniref:Uncharacterized protein n=1 Tax=Rhizophagus irregularis TaxID=588596 RepID=A0A2N1MMR4_9GLOM|nr:hypothetical protein RhiirC2_789685 [Rhizophagus irregularis]
MALCLVLGEEVTDRFIFDISDEMWTSMKISHLRDGIKEKASFSVPIHKIKLLKEELECTLLDAEDSISIKIDKVPTDNHIHIMT